MCKSSIILDVNYDRPDFPLTIFICPMTNTNPTVCQASHPPPRAPHKKKNIRAIKKKTKGGNNDIIVDFPIHSII